jgi:hypothetical protein
MIKESGKILPTLDCVPDSRAETADSSTSLSREQEQQNLISHTHPLPDGEPHPEHPLVVLGHNPLEPNWQNEHQAAAGNLGFFGANPHPNPMQQAHHNQHQQGQHGHVYNDDMQIDDDENDMEADEEPDAEPEGGEPWPQWDPTIFVGDNVQGNQVQTPQIPQHPSIPQDLLDLDLSGSSVRFLRGEGPNIAIDEVIQLGSDDSSSPSDASPVPNADRARFIAAQSHCATVNNFHRKNLLGSNQAKSSTIAIQPIFIDRRNLVDQQIRLILPQL